MEIKNKEIVWGAFVLLLGFFVPMSVFYFLGDFNRVSGSSSFFYFSNKNNTATLKNTKSVELVFVGDIMLSRGVEESISKNFNGDFSFLFNNVDFLKEADIAFGNLEGPISLAGKDVGSVYSFKFNPDVLNVLYEAGFDVLSVANNHIADWGKEAFEENIFRLKNKGILPVGGGMDFEDASAVKILERDGVKIGFVGFSDVGADWFLAGADSSGILSIKNNFEDIIKRASRGVDVLVVSFHFGEEYKNKSNERQKYLARTAIDNGAKIVVGHHVVQEIESYNGGVIAYSLGNFIFDQNFSEETMRGLVLKVYLLDNEIVAVKQLKTKLNKFYQPELTN